MISERVASVDCSRRCKLSNCGAEFQTSVLLDTTYFLATLLGKRNGVIAEMVRKTAQSCEGSSRTCVRRGSNSKPSKASVFDINSYLIRLLA